MSSAAFPRADNPQEGGQESTGAVASDSLAAESLKSGGGFADNENAAVSSVKGSNSTLNNTDTSGATALHPARDGAEREKQDAQGLGADEKGVTGVKLETAGKPEFSGTISDQGYSGSAQDTSSAPKTTTGGTFSGASGDSFASGGSGLSGSSSSQTAGVSSGQGQTSQSTGRTDNTSSGTTSSSTGTSGGSGQGDDTAPNYAGVVSGAIQSEGQGKPKGDNLTEGDIPQTKTFTGNVGGDKDPGRVAEQSFQKVSAQNTASAGPQQYGGSGADSTTGGAFDALSSERAPDSSVPDRT